MQKRIIVRLLAALGLLLMLVTPALAQGQLFFRDEANELDEAVIRQAAAPLLQRGALLAIYTEENGTVTSFRQFFIDDGLVNSSGGAREQLIAISIGFGSSYSAINYGDSWARALATNNRYEQIRSEDLNTGLRNGDPTQGVVDALESINAAIASTSAGSAPSGGASVPVPASDEGDNTWLWLLGGGALVGGGALALNRRRKGASAAAPRVSAKQQFEQRRQEAGAAITDARISFQDADDKARYDKVSYPPAEVASLTEQQGTAQASFNQALQNYAAVEEAFKARDNASAEEYQQATESYRQAIALVEQARSQLAPVVARRTELDQINAAAQPAVSAAQQAAQELTQQAAALGDFQNPSAVTREVDALIARAQQLLNDRQGAEASAAAQTATASVAALRELLNRFAGTREHISTGRASADQVAAQGFRTEAGLAAYQKAETVLQQAAVLLEGQGSQAALPLLEQAEALAAEGTGRGGGMPALLRENTARISSVEQAGQQLPALITQGHTTFDQVDEYAPSTWTDIRGNGSEAEAATGRARALLERARARNTMETQDIYGAKLDLDAAEQEIAQARRLIDTIVTRLSDLQTSQANARKELEMAQADIERGWQYVRANDADVGAEVEAALRRAEESLRAASAEAGQPKPNWIAVVKQAQEANKQADEALAQAQGESVAMDKLREQLGHARELAQAETQRLLQFAQLHQDDLSPATLAGIQRVQQQAKQAEQGVARAETAVEAARVKALRAAQERFTALTDTAEDVYQSAYNEFQAVEKIRAGVNGEAQRATLAIQQAERSLQTYSAYIPRNSEGIQLLERAHALMKAVGTVRTEADVPGALENLREATRNAESADALFRGYANTPTMGGGGYGRGGGAGDFVGGMVIGSLLGGRGGGGNHGSWGSSSGGGSGGGGGGWGSFGGGGGDWGGGGGGGGGGW